MISYIFLTLVAIVGVVMGLPVIVYMCVKFGATGYFRAKQRNEEKLKNKNHEIE